MSNSAVGNSEWVTASSHRSDSDTCPENIAAEAAASGLSTPMSPPLDPVVTSSRKKLHSAPALSLPKHLRALDPSATPRYATRQGVEPISDSEWHLPRISSAVGFTPLSWAATMRYARPGTTTTHSSGRFVHRMSLCCPIFSKPVCEQQRKTCSLSHTRLARPAPA